MRRNVVIGIVAAGILLACPFDDSLREYLHAKFWQPLTVRHSALQGPVAKPKSKPYAGMVRPTGDTPLDRVRGAYISGGPVAGAKALAEARAAKLSARDREEVELVAAKFKMHEGDDSLGEARRLFTNFLRTAKSADFRSEARGWIAHTYYKQGNLSAAGKIYLDELKRADSNLSREVLLDSLSMTYGHDGGEHLREHIAEYFDTPDHAVFAIQMVTNPRFNAKTRHDDPDPVIPHERILELLEKNAKLFESRRGSAELPVLAMRTALRGGDPARALRFAEKIPDDAKSRHDPDFLWMLGSARFLAKEYKTAAEPLLELLESKAAPHDKRFAAAYGLCGIYWKLRDPVEGLRFALWLAHENRANGGIRPDIPRVEDGSIYWASSGFDLGLLLEREASTAQLREFIEKYPKTAEIGVVKYALAVRLMRENEYEQAADFYRQAGSSVRAARALHVAKLYRAVETGDPEASIRFAAFLNENSERVYFNDRLWGGYQSYALWADNDYRFTKEEREWQRTQERQFKDDQEERWRAHLLLRDVVNGSAPIAVRRRAAALDLECLVRLSTRFGRAEEIRTAIAEMRGWLRKSREK
jgi:tetratricopeptide (TPR) repeat protein